MSWDKSNRSQFLLIVKKASGLPDKKTVKRKIRENEVDDIVSTLKSKDFDLKDNEINFLIRYRNMLQNHEESARRISLIEKNFSEVENIYSELENEINTIIDESIELEKIATALEDKELRYKAKQDEDKADKLHSQLKHLVSMKQEMESREAALESMAETFDDIEHALQKRIAILETLITENGDGMEKKNATDGLVLKKGMELVSSGGGYKLVIDEEYNSAIMSAVNSAIDPSDSERGKAEDACKQIHNIFSTPKNDSENNDRISRQKRSDGKIYLSDVWADGEGVCKELAATLQLVYQQLGIKSGYMRGKLGGQRHAWLKLRADGNQYTADPTNDVFQDYSSSPSYNEGDNIVKIPDRYI